MLTQPTAAQKHVRDQRPFCIDITAAGGRVSHEQEKQVKAGSMVNFTK